MTAKKYTELIKNIMVLGLGLVGSKFVQFILLPYFTNVLTTAEYGVIDLVVTFVGLLVPIVTLELSDSVLRFGLSNETDKTDLVKCALTCLTFATVITIIGSPLLFFYKTIWPYRYFIVGMIVLQGIRTNEALFVKAQDRVLVYSIDSILTALIIAIFDIFFISILKVGIEGYFCAELIGNTFSIVFLLLCGKIYQNIDLGKPLDKELLRRMLKYSIPLMFNAISWWITSFSDRAVLNIFFSESEVGLYSVAAKIPAIITTLLSVFTQAWIMSAVKEYEKENNPSFFNNIRKIYSAILFVGIGMAILIIKPLMKIYVGDNFFEAWYYVPFLLVGTAFLGISNYYGAIYAAAKANLLEIKSTLICAISNIILNFVLIPRSGIMGAVLATSLSYIIVVIVRIIDTKKIMTIKPGILDLILSSGLLMLEVYYTMLEQKKMMITYFVILLIWKGIVVIYENSHMQTKFIWRNR